MSSQGKKKPAPSIQEINDILSCPQAPNGPIVDVVVQFTSVSSMERSWATNRSNILGWSSQSQVGVLVGPVESKSWDAIQRKREASSPNVKSFECLNWHPTPSNESNKAKKAQHNERKKGTQVGNAKQDYGPVCLTNNITGASTLHEVEETLLKFFPGVRFHFHRRSRSGSQGMQRLLDLSMEVRKLNIAAYREKRFLRTGMQKQKDATRVANTAKKSRENGKFVQSKKDSNAPVLNSN